MGQILASRTPQVNGKLRFPEIKMEPAGRAATARGPDVGQWCLVDRRTEWVFWWF